MPKFQVFAIHNFIQIVGFTLELNFKKKQIHIFHLNKMMNSQTNLCNISLFVNITYFMIKNLKLNLVLENLRQKRMILIKISLHSK